VLRRSLVLFGVVLAVLAAGVAAFGRPAAGPARIVSLSPTATETLFAIGAGKQVVAVDKSSNYPPSAPHTSLDGTQSSAEQIASYNPDLVVIQYDPGGLVKALGKLKIQVLVQPAASSLTSAYAQIAQLGAATGHKAAAAAVVSKMKTGIAAAVGKAKSAASGKTVYYELDNTLYSVTSKTFIGQILSLFGLKDIADKAAKAASGYPQLSNEYVVSANPDVIVLADTKCCRQSAATLAKRPGWNDIAAVQNHDVIPLDDDIASRWGPRVVALVQALAAGLKQA
jgi:iron complex transport system substrate-binding protein